MYPHQVSIEAALCLNKIGELQRRSNRAEKARRTFESCVDILLRLVSPQDQVLITPLYNLGVSLHAEQNYSDGQLAYERAIQIDQSVHGDWHVEAANMYDNLGVLLSEQEKYQEALPYLEKALALYRRKYGDAHKEVSLSLNNIALVVRCLGDHATAISLYSESLLILRGLADGTAQVPLQLKLGTSCVRLFSTRLEGLIEMLYLCTVSPFYFTLH